MLLVVLSILFPFFEFRFCFHGVLTVGLVFESIRVWDVVYRCYFESFVGDSLTVSM